jgi:beta-1,4-mannooligosaccharide/beta-1,4-mannosyl-N-acetylglucosamine phosphorylase
MAVETIGELQSSPVVTRHPENPVLSAEMVPYGPTLTYNAGVAKFQGRYVMVFRNDYTRPDMSKPKPSDMGLAFSDDGVHWQVEPEPCLAWHDEEVHRAYDPRLTVMDGRCYICFAIDTKHGIRGGIAVTDDFRDWEILSTTTPDNRNMVLFPERIGGRYVRLERPFPIYGRPRDVHHFDCWMSESPDLVHWGNPTLILGGEHVPYANDKVGPGAPPLKTPAGWLTFFHAVDIDPSRGKNGWEKQWPKRYCAGVMLLDLQEPSKVIGLYKKPLLAPEAEYEVSGGLRNNVIFPGGAVLEEDGEVKIYYGAADTVECLATAHVDDLIGLCLGNMG